MPRIVVTLPDGDKLVYPLEKITEDAMNAKPVSIGRNDSCDFVIPSGSVSGLHAYLEAMTEGYRLKDAGSTNGLLLDGVLQDSIELKDGMCVFMGDAALKYLEGEQGTEKNAPASAEPAAPVASSADTPADAPAEMQKEASAAVERDMPPAPPVKELHYENGENDGEVEPDLSKPVQVVSKSYYVRILLYGIIIFILAMLSGLIYKHYTETGELLPYKWLGIESPKEKLEKEIKDQEKAIEAEQAELAR